MQVRVEEQDVDAQVVADGPDGSLLLRPGLVSPRAFVALVLALEEGRQYLQSTG